MPDVELTIRLFARAVTDGAAAGLWANLRQLDTVAYLPPKPPPNGGNCPHEQPSLFG